MTRFLVGFYCGAGMMLGTVSAAFGAPAEQIVFNAMLWPIPVASFLASVFGAV